MDCLLAEPWRPGRTMPRTYSVKAGQDYSVKAGQGYSVKAGPDQLENRRPFTQHRAPKASDSTPGEMRLDSCIPLPNTNPSSCTATVSLTRVLVDLKPLLRRSGRPPLIALEDGGSNTFDTNSSLGSPAPSVWAAKNKKDDPFDKLFNKKEDTFDKLFNKTEDSFDKMRTCSVQQRPLGLFQSGLSTPDSTAATDRCSGGACSKMESLFCPSFDTEFHLVRAAVGHFSNVNFKKKILIW